MLSDYHSGLHLTKNSIQIGALTLLHIIGIMVLYVTPVHKDMQIYQMSDGCATSTVNLFILSLPSYLPCEFIHDVSWIMAADFSGPPPAVRQR